MKLTVLQENLSKGLSTVAPAVSTRSTLPITQNVMVTAEKARLKLVATNLEMCITTWVGGKVEKEGAVTMPHTLLTDFVNSMPNEAVYVEDDGRSVNFVCGRYKGNIGLVPAEDFPPVPKVEGLSATVKGEDLRAAIARVVFAASHEESRPVMVGVNFAFGDKGLTLAAADGFRLAIQTLQADVKQKGSVIIPARTVAQLSRLVSDDDSVEVHVSKDMVLFKLKNVELTSTLINGNFPNYIQLIPKDCSIKAVVDAEQLHQAVKIASLFSRGASGQVRVKLVEGKPGKVTVAGMEEEVGDNVSQVEAQVNQSGKIAFNSKYLLELLSVLKGPLSMEISSPSAPALFKVVDKEDYQHIIMPMFIGGEW